MSCSVFCIIYLTQLYVKSTNLNERLSCQPNFENQDKEKFAFKILLVLLILFLLFLTLKRKTNLLHYSKFHINEAICQI